MQVLTKAFSTVLIAFFFVRCNGSLVEKATAPTTDRELAPLKLSICDAVDNLCKTLGENHSHCKLNRNAEYAASCSAPLAKAITKPEKSENGIDVGETGRDQQLSSFSAVPRIADWNTAQSYMRGQHEEGFGPRVLQRILQYLINDYTTQAFGRDKSSWGVAKEVWSCKQTQQDFADGVNPAADLFMTTFFKCRFKFAKEFINAWASKAVAADCATCTKVPKDASQETMTHQLEYRVIIAAKLACTKDGASFQATRLMMDCCQPLDMDAARKCYNEAKIRGTSFDTDNCKGLQLKKNTTSAELATCSSLFTVM